MTKAGSSVKDVGVCVCISILTLSGDPAMSMSIVDAIGTIKRNVASCLSASSIERACSQHQYRWRRRDLGPVKTLQAFVLQVLHGNTACTDIVRLANLNCT